MGKTILHCDMNNCYASIEKILNPELEGLPIAVCGSKEDRHGIVLAKSQEAKVLGVKTGEVIWQAKNKCPDLLIVPPHYEEYLKYSKMARDIYYQYTNQVEAFGIDECWLDVTGSTHLFGSGREIADELRARMKRELGLTISVGVSFNKIFAKLGSDLKKPDATTVISLENFKEIVWNLKADELMGIGRKTKNKLLQYGIITLGDLANSDPSFLKDLLGINGLALWNYCNGRDSSIVSDAYYQSPIKSIGRGITCREDLNNLYEAKCVFQDLSLDVSKKLRENGFKAGGVQISIRDNDLMKVQFQRAMDYPTLSSIALCEQATGLLNERYNWFRPIRSLTIRAIDLVHIDSGLQLDMFGDIYELKRKESIDSTIYQVRERWGKSSITFASLMGDIKMPMERTDVVTLPNGSNRQ